MCFFCSFYVDCCVGVKNIVNFFVEGFDGVECFLVVDFFIFKVFVCSFKNVFVYWFEIIFVFEVR